VKRLTFAIESTGHPKLGMLK